MARLMGINVLADGSPSVNEDEMKVYLARLRPYAAVIMDNAKMYQQTLTNGSVTLPIFRRFDRNDAKWHEVMTPQEWIDQHKPYFFDGAIIQVYNEPGGYQDLRPLAKWSAALLDLAPANVCFVLPNFAVGNPDIKRVNDGELDDLFKALAKHKRHFLGVHEYFLSDPLQETPESGQSDEPLIGRYRVFYRRFEALGLPRPQIVITEHGRDKGGGRGPDGDGWSRQMGEDQYIQHLQNAMQNVYSPDNVPVCIFCYGRGFSDDWMTFDIRSAKTVLDSLVALNETLGDSFDFQAVVAPPEPPAAPPPPTAPKRPAWQPQPINPAGRKAYVGNVSAVDGHWTQVYAEPTTTAKDVGDLMFGQRLVYYPHDPREGFVNVEYDGISGWVQVEPRHIQFEGAVFLAPVAPPPPGSGGTPSGPGDDMSRRALLDLAAHYDELAQQSDAVVAQFTALATRYHGLADEYRTAAARVIDVVQPSPPVTISPPMAPVPPPVSVSPPTSPPPPPPMAGGYINVIIDISHHNRVTSFADLKADGILGIIHKATQGTTHIDSWYLRRRDNARPYGFLWGAYHFGVGGAVSEQVNHFLDVVQPDAQTLLVLDWERNPTSGQTTMNREEAEAFVQQIHDRTGRYPVLYTRANFLHQHIGNDTTILSQCPLWIAYWANNPTPPSQWSKIHIWQYTGDGKGPEPHTVNGVTGAIDRDKFNGSVEDLRKFWAATS